MLPGVFKHKIELLKMHLKKLTTLYISQKLSFYQSLNISSANLISTIIFALPAGVLRTVKVMEIKDCLYFL